MIDPPAQSDVDRGMGLGSALTVLFDINWHKGWRVEWM